MTVLEKMGEQIAAHRDTPLPEPARKLLANHFLDSVGAWIAGSATEEGKKLAALRSHPGVPIPFLTDVPLDRLALGVATTRLTEIDDIHMASCTTPGSVVVPTALAIAAQLKTPDARSFAHALSAGYEVMTHFGSAIKGAEILSRGIWPTYFAAPLGAAAVTACVLRLGAAETANALAIALTAAASSPGRPVGASPRWLLLGLAARAGSAAALSAGEGYAGDLTLLDGNWLVHTHGIACDPEPLAAAAPGHGAVAELSLKPWCAAKQTVAAIEAFRNLLAKGISTLEIERVCVGVPSAYASMIGHSNAAGGRVGRITSVAYQLALAALHPNELDNVSRPNLAADPEIAAFMGRVEVATDEALGGYYPQNWPARVEVKLNDGSEASELVVDAAGDPNRASEVDVLAKFHRQADPINGWSAATQLAEACLSAIEDDQALRNLCEKCFP